MTTILITGVSSGFGRLAVPLLLQRGHTVIAAIRGGEDRLRKIFDAELALHPDRLIACDLHLDDSGSFEKAARVIDEQFGGKLDVLINNAGLGLFGALEDISPEQLRAQLEVNFFGPVLLTRRLLPQLRAARGRALFVSSLAGRVSFPLYGAYSASKFALEGLVEGLRFDLSPHQVQVALIEPGGFKTEFTHRRELFGADLQAPASPYRARTERLKWVLEAWSSRQGNPMRVARLLARLSDARTIAPRYLIGMDARLVTFLSWLLPARVRIGLIGWAYRKVVFKD